MLPSLLVFSYQIHKRSIDKIDTTEIQLMELNSFKEVANNIGEGCGNVPIVLVRCTVGDLLYYMFVCLFVFCLFCLFISRVLGDGMPVT